MQHKDIRKYYKHLKSLISHAKVTNHEYAVFHREIQKKNYLIQTYLEHPLRFSDNAQLKFTEHITFEGGLLERKKYAIMYSRPDGFFFRYDKAPSTESYPEHALCHLHVHPNERAPRFITHETSVEEVFNFIIATYYP